MIAVFLHLFNLSVMAGWMVLAVLLLRLCLKKAPRWITCVLWGLVALRLLVPFTIESPISLLPTAETVVSGETADNSTPVVNSGMEAIDKPLNDWLQTPVPSSPPVGNTTPNVPEGETGVIPQPPVEDTPTAPDEKPTDTEEKSVSRMEQILQIAAPVWLVGIGLMLLYELVSVLRVRSRVLDAVRLRDNVWQSDRVSSPFIFGLFRPRIYVPYDLEEPMLEQVLSHERAHLHRRDHWIKPFAFTLLAVYWYNPLLWVGYILLCKDIELACDEKVLAELGEESKKPYSNALINCSAPRRMISACPLAFGENGVKSRVKSILHYKKPTLWILIGAILVTSFAAVWFLTDPLKEENVIAWEEIPGMDYEKEEALLELKAFPGVTFRCSSSELVALTEEGEKVLFIGMPIVNVYFTDLNGDEMPEICGSTLWGSGWISGHVYVYDYAAGECYELSDRPKTDYCLYEENDRLMVRAKDSYDHNKQTTGLLALEEQNGEICLVMKEQHTNGVVSDESVSVEPPSSDNETSLRDPNENEEYVEETPLDESIANWFGWQDLAYVKDIALEEYPGKTFYIGGSREKRWEIRMRDEEEDHLLFRADQIAGAYFMDLNGDGMRELLIWYTLGSSNVSAHVGVYDIVAMEKYEAGVKDEYDCWLTEQNGFLYLEVTPYGREKPISILGTPVLTEKNGEVVIDMVDAVAFGRDGTSFPVGRTLYKTTPDAMGLMSSNISLFF